MAAAASHPFVAPIPPATLEQHGTIRFLHPGYPAPTNILLALPRVDPASDSTFGVHYQTALVACQIIANNAFATGRLTRDWAGQQPVCLPLDGILTEDFYYFLVGDSPDQYPVVPSFQDWEFPHGRIPDSWPAPFPPVRTRRCSITNFSGPLERAHLVPQEEGAWFLRNGMGWDSTSGTIHDSANILPLRRDLHACFDSRLFVIVPKAFAATPGSPQYVVYFIQQNEIAAEYWSSTHHCLVQNLSPRSRPYLFARFAWAILFHVKQFITVGYERRVVIRIDKPGTTECEEKVLSGEQLIAAYGSGGSRDSRASSKRKGADSMMEEDEDWTESSSEDCDMDGLWDNGWEGRVTKRREQHSSEETAPDAEAADAVRELRTTLAKVLPATSLGGR